MNLELNDYTSYVSVDSCENDVRKIFSRSYDEHIKFFENNSKKLKKSHTGLHGKFSEKIFKDWFVCTHEMPYLIADSDKKIHSFLPPSPSGAVDISFKSRIEVGVNPQSGEKIYETAIHIGSGKNGFLSSKKILSIADSDFNNEYIRCGGDAIVNEYKHREGWLVINEAIDVMELYNSYKDKLSHLNIVLFDDKVFDFYLKTAPKGIRVKNFISRVRDLLDSGWLVLHSLKRLYFETQETLKKYEDYNELFDNLYGVEQKFSLYFVQKLLCDEALEKYRNNVKNVCLTASVRSGKSTMAGHICRELWKGNTYKGVVVALESFFPDTFNKVRFDFIRSFGVNNVNFIEVSNDDDFKIDPDKMNLVNFSGQWTVSNEIKPAARKLIRVVDFLIFDEAHYGYGSEKQSHFRAYMKKNARVLAMTATPGASLDFFEHVRFTELDMIRSVQEGHKHYMNHPQRIRIVNDVFSKNGNAIINRTFESASALVSNQKDVRDYFKWIMNYCINGITVDEQLEHYRKILDDNTYGSNYVRVYHPRNFLVFCNNKKELKNVYEALKYAIDYDEETNFTVDWTVSGDEGNSIGKKMNPVEFANRIFAKRDDKFHFLLVVGQCTIGATIENLEGCIMLTNTTSYAEYEQATGRCCQPVKKNGRYLNFTFIFDPLANRSLCKIDGEKIKYLTNKKYYTENSREVNYVRAMNMCMTTTGIKSINKKLLSEFILANEVLPKLQIGLTNLDKVEWYVNPFTNMLNEFDVNDERFDYERLRSVIEYLNGSIKHTVTSNFSKKSVVVYEKFLSESEEGKESGIEKNKLSPREILEQLWKVFITRITMMSLSRMNFLKEILESKTEDEFYSLLTNLMNQTSQKKPLWRQYFNDTIFKPEICSDFEDILGIFYDRYNPNKRYVTLNNIRENIEMVMSACLIHNRGDVLRMVMTNNAVAEFGEVFTPIKFIEEVIVPSIVARYKHVLKKKNLKIADIACGSGNFFVALYDTVFKYQRHHFDSDDECERHIIKNVFYGCDIQECHVITAKNSIDPNNLVPDNPHFICYDTLSSTFDFWGGTHFDIIIGNPPYQKESKKGLIGAPQIYNKFVELAKKHSDIVIQIIKASWIMKSNMESFRKAMLTNHLLELYNYSSSKLIFPNFDDIPGSCCWFIWDKNYEGSTKYTYTTYNTVFSYDVDMLNFDGVFYRNAIDKSIRDKVLSKHTLFFNDIISPGDFFKTKENGQKCIKVVTDVRVNDDDVLCKTSRGDKYLIIDRVKKHRDYIDIRKICVPAAYGSNPITGGDYVMSKPVILEKGYVCSDSYNIVMANLTDIELENCLAYMKMRPVRQLLKQNKNSQGLYRDVWSLVPWQDFKEPWTEERFYETYGYTQEEIDYVNSTIKQYQD